MDAHKRALQMHARAFVRAHQENIINGNRSRIWLGLTPAMGEQAHTERARARAIGDEAPRQIPRGYRIE